MLSINTNPSVAIDWKDIPVSTEDEAGAKKAAYTFYAETTLSEKIGRIANAAMFSIVGLKLLSFVPGIGTVSANLAGKFFTTVGGTSLLQFPTAVAASLVAVKIIIAIAFILAVRKIIAIAICHIVYPAVLDSYFNGDQLDGLRKETFNQLIDKQFECRRIALNKSGIDYDAFAISSPKHDQWAILAGGNGWIGETSIESCAHEFHDLGFNILFVNGPGVGRSTGFPTSYSIGAGQEAGLQFLERAIQAKKILIYGTSLGAGAQAEALLNHQEFPDDIHYLVWSDRTFDTLSNAASEMVCSFVEVSTEKVSSVVKALFFILGIELHNLNGAKKLQALGIKHIVTQNNYSVHFGGDMDTDEIEEQGTDGVIPNHVSLHVGARKAGIQDGRIDYFLHPSIDHNGSLPLQVSHKLNPYIKDFFNNPLQRTAAIP